MSPSPKRQPAVLFVCLGNICRSPLAEAAFRAQAEKVGLDCRIDSAGTGDWHVGRPPDPRACAVALRQGIDISGYQARQVAAEDFMDFSHVVALDASNLRDLQALKPAQASARLSLLLDYAPGRRGEAVADPYYGDEAGFEQTWADVQAGAQGLCEQLLSAARSPAQRR